MKDKIKKTVIGFAVINLIFSGWVLLEEWSIFGQELFFAVAPVLIILFFILDKSTKTWIFLSLISETVIFLILKNNQAAQNLSNMLFLFFILLVFEKTKDFFQSNTYED